MKDWKKSMVQPDMTLMQVLQAISDSAVQTALVVDNGNHLIGIITDGDVRRALLRGVSMSEPARAIMNEKPITVQFGQKKASIISMMQRLGIRYAPVVDDDGIVIGFYELQELLAQKVRPNPVIIMAGGLGTRLRPLTDNCPKPLLRVGNKPILETILESFVENGFRLFYFSVNYRSDMIEDYFGDGNQYGAEISYLHEDERLGTAGALSLLPKELNEPIVVMNGDLLTKVDFGEFLDHHVSEGVVATMGVREYSWQIPYGVVEMEDSRISRITEKPVHHCYVNAGMYVLSPEAVQHVPAKTYLDMPELFRRIMAEGKKTSIYPIRDYWMDIGQMDDFRQAQGEYAEVFGTGDGHV